LRVRGQARLIPEQGRNEVAALAKRYSSANTERQFPSHAEIAESVMFVTMMSTVPTGPVGAVAKINGATLGTTTATDKNILIANGTSWVSQAVSGDITIGNTGVTAIGSSKVTSAMIVDGVLEPMEVAHLPYKKGRTFEDYLGIRGLKRLGKKKWRRYVSRIAEQLKIALEAEYVVLGGGNSKLLKSLPPGCRRGDNSTAFTGGFRLWDEPGEQARWNRGHQSEPPKQIN
jgi:hypothetical protein